MRPHTKAAAVFALCGALDAPIASSNLQPVPFDPDQNKESETIVEVIPACIQGAKGGDYTVFLKPTITPVQNDAALLVGAGTQGTELGAYRNTLLTEIREAVETVMKGKDASHLQDADVTRKLTEKFQDALDFVLTKTRIEVDLDVTPVALGQGCMNTSPAVRNASAARQP